MLAEYGNDANYKTVRRSVLKFGLATAAYLKSRRVQSSGTWHFDEVLVRNAGVAKTGAYAAKVRFPPFLSHSSPFDWTSRGIGAVVSLRPDLFARVVRIFRALLSSSGTFPLVN